MWTMFQFSNDTSLFVRLLLISRGVKFSFNPENDFFLFTIQTGHDIPAFSFIFIAVRNFN